MNDSTPNVAWVPAVEEGNGPMYLAIAEAIARDIRAGVLRPGQRLPPQRALASVLGIDFTTVSRAYSAAGKDGLVEGRVGQGTYVKESRPANPVASDSAKNQTVDMSMNVPPRLEDAGLVRSMWQGFDALRSEHGVEFLMRYQMPGGSHEDQQAAQFWLQRHLGLQPHDDIIICNGVQGATWTILSLILEPGDTICCEELTYPGLLALARHLKLNVVPIPMDADGLDPDALDEVCQTAKPRAIYATPTLHNPTTITMPVARRARIAEVARKHDLHIIEDDAYGVLASTAPDPLCAIAPERTWYVSSLSKCLAPSLRVCFMVPPSGTSNDSVRRAMRANGSVVSPISARLATNWITSGLADKILSAIRFETERRQGVLHQSLPDIRVPKDAFHVWLPLPGGCSAIEFVLKLRGSGLGLVPGAAFALGKAPNAVRVALGSPDTAANLGTALRKLVDALENADQHDWMVV
ncbi:MULTISPECIES: PLP-dependent aminotransferase family protein [unclassified Ruegeria]|uniref:aminotransferase-like domain-containing protein n=1 Tax=unclassified Ruegeria TaxID=2625375 RepID=UPI001487DB0A|nr:MULTISPECIES: PLP-dependent aminotransferase family protein [unclassified Ruegeria]